MENTIPTGERSGRRVLSLLSHKRRYVENFAWLLSDRVIRILVGVVVAGMVARYLGREAYGTLNYAISITFMLTPFAALGLHQSVMRELIATPDRAGDLLGTSLALKLLSGSLTLLLLCCYAFLFEQGITRWLVMLIGLNLLIDAAYAFDTWFESQTKSRYVALSCNVAFLTAAALKISLIALKAPLIWFGVVIVIQGIICLLMKVRFLFSAFPNRKGWRWSPELVRPLLAGGLPLILLTINLALMKRLDIFMLQKMGSLHETGVYSSAALLADVLFMIPALIGVTVLPGLMRQRERNRMRYRESVVTYFKINAFLGYTSAVGFIVTMPIVLPIVFSDRFADATPMAQILGITALPLFLATSRQDYLFAEGKASTLIGAGAVALLVNVGLNVWLIPTSGGIGAAWATVASCFIYAIAGSFFHPGTRWVGRKQLMALIKPWPGTAIAAAIAQSAAAKVKESSNASDDESRS